MCARLSGGSSSINTQGRDDGRWGLFKSGVDEQYVSKKSRPTLVKILPAFDDSLSLKDTNFMVGTTPYRSLSGEVDPTTRTPAFTSWFIQIPAHKFVGPAGHSFVSPLIRKLIGDESVRDPLVDCFNVAQSDDDYKELLEGDDASLKRRKNLAVMNVMAYYEKERKWINRVLSIPMFALTDGLLPQLCIPRGANVEVMHEAFDRFMLGDITDMEKCVVPTLEMGRVGQMTCPVFVFSNDQYSLDGANIRTDFSAQTDFGRQCLRARKDLQDIEDATTPYNIPTEEQIVRMLYDDGVVPPALLVKACGRYVDLPDSITKGASHHSPEAAPEAGSNNAPRVPQQPAANTPRPAQPAGPGPQVPPQAPRTPNAPGPVTTPGTGPAPAAGSATPPQQEAQDTAPISTEPDDEPDFGKPDQTDQQVSEPQSTERPYPLLTEEEEKELLQLKGMVEATPPQPMTAEQTLRFATLHSKASQR